MSGVADAAVTGVDAVPETATNQLPGDNSHTITGTNTNDAGGGAPIRFAITAGPNTDLAGNGANAADGNCTLPTTTTFSCTYTGFNNTSTGTDTIKVFADNNANNLFDAGEPFDDVLKTFSGPVFAVTMTPAADQAAIGTCNPFTVTVRDVGGNPNPGAVVDVILTPAVAQNADFCVLAAPGATVPQTATDLTAGGAGVAERAEFTTNATGQVTFGVTADVPGVINVRAFSDTGNNDVFDAGEPNSTSVKTFVAGGTEAVTTVDASPETATNFTGEVHTITVALTNAAGDTIANVTPSIDITAGPNAAVTPICGASNQAGIASCTYTGTSAGTDTIVVFVNKLAGATAGPDDNEPQDTVLKTFVAAPTGLVATLTCAGTIANTSTSACVNPTDDPTEVFTARVTNGVGGTVAPGVLVRFAITATGVNTTDNDATLAPLECTTTANGTCTTTLTNPSPANLDSVTVTATVAGTGITALATKVWQTRVATTLALTPAFATNTALSSHTVTATVRDQFGTPVVGTNVDFFVAGRNGISGLDRTTGATGTATFTYTDTGNAATDGPNDVISAFADLNDDDNDNLTPEGEPTGTATKRFISESTTTADLEIDMQGCNATFGAGPGFTPVSNESTATNAVGTTHQVCALVRSSEGDVLQGSTVTFTSTGVGHFANSGALSHTDLGTTTTATVDANGRASVFLHSTVTGTQTVTATAVGGETDSGTKTWTNVLADARNIDVSPNVATNRPGQPHAVTARVTDRFGNGVSGVQVTFTESGPGSFSSLPGSVEPGTVTGTTGADGRVTVETSNNTTQLGTQTIVGTISGASTDCDEVAGSPSGTTAGNCSETVTKIWSLTGGPTAAPGTFFPVTPARIFDTRDGTGTTVGKMGPSSTRIVDVTGFGGVPATGATAVVVNLTITEGTAATYLSVTPNGGNATSNLNVLTGETRANLVKVAIGSDGNIRVFNILGNAHVIMDVFGYYSDTLPNGSRFNSLAPNRIVDTRTASTVGTFTPAGKLGAGVANEKTVDVTGVGGVPATGVTAVVVNATVTEGTAPSFLAVTPNGGAATSNINFSVNQDIPNLVVVQVGADGNVRVNNGAGQVNFIFDVVGWYGAPGAITGSQFTPVDPQRILDTRSGVGTFTPAGKLGAGAANQKTVNVTGVGGVPTLGVTAVVLNLTGTEGTAATFITVSPGGGGSTSNLNIPAANQDKAVLVVVPVDALGNVKVFNAVGQVHVVFDVVGYFGP